MFRNTNAQYERLPDPFPPAYQANYPYTPEDVYRNTSPFIMMSTFDKNPQHSVYSVVSQEPDDNGSAPRTLSIYTPRDQRLSSWRVGAMLAATLACVSLLVNVSVAVWAIKEGALKKGVVEVYRGDCKQVTKINTWVHLAINVVSTALLSGSNYCMQILSAPTRKEIDEAHAKGKWLDIGVPSLRNLRSVSRMKVILWWCLGLSSIPLHLMYNSSFFSSLGTNDYKILYVEEAFVKGASFNYTDFDGFDVKTVQQSLGSYETLQNADCIKAYATDFNTDRRTLVIVSSNISTTESSILYTDEYQYPGPGGLNQYPWICSDPNLDSKIAVTYTYSEIYCQNQISQMVTDAQQWAPENLPVERCLSEPVNGTCGFNLNLAIVVIVAMCNLGKLLSMLYVSYRIQDDPLITIGDAVDSFLSAPDKNTTGLCLVSKKQIVARPQRPGWRPETAKKMRNSDGPPDVWQPRKHRWFNAASKSRWFWCVSLFAIALGAVTFLLWFAIMNLQTSRSAKGLWDLGLGQVHSQAMISGWAISNIESPGKEILASVLIANLPQGLLSFLYLTLNGLCTSMFLSEEWSHYATERKSLRVSTPKGGQRKTYFLQLPYRIALPLMGMSGLLHWLISQSIFLAVVAEYDKFGNLYSSVAVATCGFSPFAMVCVLIAGGFMITFIIALGFRKFDGKIPLAGSCSAAIAAACHPPGWDKNCSTGGIQWGAVAGMTSANGIGHCSFSSDHINAPVPGNRYAGLS